MIAQRMPECKLEEVQQLTASLEGYVHEAAREGLPIHQVEEEVWRRVREVGVEVGVVSDVPRRSGEFVSLTGATNIRPRNLF